MDSLCFYSCLHISMAGYFTSTLVGSVRKVDGVSLLARKIPAVPSELLFLFVLKPGKATRITRYLSLDKGLCCAVPQFNKPQHPQKLFSVGKGGQLIVTTGHLSESLQLFYL